MNNDLDNIEQIDSFLDLDLQIDSELQNMSHIDSFLGNVIAIAKQYVGIENDLIDVVVDNINETIEAKSKTYVFEQAIPASTWIITHNLNKYPSITVIDSAGDQVFANANYVNANQIILEFSAEFGGTAYLN